MKNKKILPWIVTVLLLIAYAFSQNIIKIHYYHYETPHFNPAFFEEDFDSISTVKSYAIEMDFVEATEEDYLQALALKYHFSSDYAEKINKEQTKDRSEIILSQHAFSENEKTKVLYQKLVIKQEKDFDIVIESTFYLKTLEIQYANGKRFKKVLYTFPEKTIIHSELHAKWEDKKLSIYFNEKDKFEDILELTLSGKWTLEQSEFHGESLEVDAQIALNNPLERTANFKTKRLS